MAKQKKSTQLQKTLNKMVAEKEKLNAQREEALGISVSNDGNVAKRKIITYKNLMWVKIALLASIPVLYFLYSPLLVVPCILYASTFFATKWFEKRANKGLEHRKNLCIKLPRWDAIIAIVLIGMVVFGLILSISTMSSKPSDFEGMSQNQVRNYLESKGVPKDTSKKAAQTIVELGANKSRGEKYLTQFSTMFTGERVLFKSRNTGIFGFGQPAISAPPGSVVNNSGGNNGGGTLLIKGQNGQADTRLNLGDISGKLSDIPAVNTLAAIVVVLNSMLMAGIIGIGVYSVIKMKRTIYTKQYDIIKDDKPKKKF